MGGRLYTLDEDETIIRFSGVIPAKEIATLIGRSPEATAERARVLGVSLMLRGERHHLAKYSDAVIEQARHLHDQGVPARSIAEQIGLPVKYVWRVVAFGARCSAAAP